MSLRVRLSLAKADILELRVMGRLANAYAVKEC